MSQYQVSLEFDDLLKSITPALNEKEKDVFSQLYNIIYRNYHHFRKDTNYFLLPSLSIQKKDSLISSTSWPYTKEALKKDGVLLAKKIANSEAVDVADLYDLKSIGFSTRMKFFENIYKQLGLLIGADNIVSILTQVHQSIENEKIPAASQKAAYFMKEASLLIGKEITKSSYLISTPDFDRHKNFTLSVLNSCELQNHELLNHIDWFDLISNMNKENDKISLKVHSLIRQTQPSDLVIAVLLRQDPQVLITMPSAKEIAKSTNTKEEEVKRFFSNIQLKSEDPSFEKILFHFNNALCSLVTTKSYELKIEQRNELVNYLISLIGKERLMSLIVSSSILRNAFIEHKRNHKLDIVSDIITSSPNLQVDDFKNLCRSLIVYDTSLSKDWWPPELFKKLIQINSKNISSLQTAHIVLQNYIQSISSDVYKKELSNSLRNLSEQLQVTISHQSLQQLVPQTESIQISKFKI